MRLHLVLFAYLFINIICRNVYGQAGTNDATFNPTDNRITMSGDVLTTAVQSDGKILMGGFFYNYGYRNIIRINSDGSLDHTFSVGTGFNNGVMVVMVQSDGKILVGGGFTSYNGNAKNGIVRLNVDGSVDNTFSIGTGFNFTSIAQTISLQSDGKILVGGDFTSYNGNARNKIVRLNTDGSIDNTFSIGTGFDGAVYKTAIQTDGKILVGGSFTSYNGNARNRIIRLNTDGSIDNIFSIGAGCNDITLAISIQTDGKILVGGSFTSYNGNARNRIVRLNANGSIDNTFSVGTGFDDQVTTIAIQSDGKILVSGNFTGYNSSGINKIIRLNTNGSIDNTFSVGTGFNFTSIAQTISIQTDEKILVGGDFTSYNGSAKNKIVRLNTDGSIDNTFSIDTGFNERTFAMGLQTDGKILVGGSFTSYGGIFQNNFIRLNTDGSADNTFSIGTGFDTPVYTIAVQTGGKILVGGIFSNYNGNARNRIVRLNTDGSIDNTFSIGTGFGGSLVKVITLQTDGKILVGGSFTSYNGNLRNRIIRLNTDGSIDNTFSIGTGFDNSVNEIELQSDGKILVGGDFTNYNGNLRNRIIRLNTDGSIDNTFSIGTGFNSWIDPIEIQTDGKIIVGGAFTSYNGNARNYLVRLNTDGSIDNAFSIGTGFDSGFYDLILQMDGKILVGGGFTSYNGNLRNRIIRLNTDGSIDNTFSIGTGFDERVFKFALQADNKLLVGGYFTIYNGTIRNRIARLLTNNCPSITIAPLSLSGGTVGNAYFQTISQTGLSGTVSWSVSVGTLPTGLSLNSSTGQISGTPSTTGTFNFTIQVTDGTCSQTQVYSVVVSCPTLVFNNTSVSNAIIGTPYNLDASISGNTQPVTYSVSPALPVGLSLNISTGVISGTPTTLTSSNIYTVTTSQSAGVCSVTQNYTFAVVCPTASLNPNTLPNATIGTAYNQTISQTGLPSGTINWSISAGSLPAGLSLNNTTGAITGIPSATGTFNFTIEASNSGCLASRAYSIVVSCPTITFTNTIVNDAIIGTSYSLDAGVTGNTQPVTYSVNPALPAGLSLNTSTGVISGIPTVLNPSTTYIITASQSSGVCSVTQNYTFAVNCAGITINPNILPNVSQLIAYSQTLSQTGLSGTITWSVISGSLPAGLTLNSSTGVISGTSNTLQTANFTIQVSNGTCSSTKVYSLTVAPSGAIMEINTTEIDFGDVLILQSSKKTITVKNIGVVPLSILSVNAPDIVFDFKTAQEVIIQPNESKEFEIYFTPIAVSSYSGIVTINSNSVSGVNTFSVKGRGINPTALNSNQNIQVSVYPNPTQEVLHLNIEKASSFEWKITDVLGKIVLKGYSNSSSNRITLKDLPESTYLLYIHAKNNTYIEKIIIQK